MFIYILGAAVLGLGIGASSVTIYNKRHERGGKNRADDLIRKAKHEAADIVLTAKKRGRSRRRKVSK